ncbi:hypothetical protein H8957_016640, partial [Semnopithecus entellus]
VGLLWRLVWRGVSVEKAQETDHNGAAAAPGPMGRV